MNESALAAIAVNIIAPEGLPEIKAILTCKPKDEAGFAAIVEACGGPSAFTFGHDYAHTKLADGSSLMVEAYDRATRYECPIAPSIARLKAAAA